MNINTQEVQQKAIALLTEGKEKFNSAKRKEDLEEGYKTFVSGIEL